jgi:competence protein ComFC
MTYIKKLYEFLIDILFPRAKEVREIEKMSADEFIKNVPEASFLSEFREKDIHPLWSYRHPLIKRAIWELKYRRNEKITRLLAEILYEKIIAELEDEDSFANFKSPLLVPIPISKKRLRARGYNQTELLAEALEALDDRRSFTVGRDLLHKTKETLPQTLMKDRERRLANLNGCFEVKNPDLVCGRNIILIDDVTTTGSTVSEATQTLKNAGAKRVITFTLAH